MYNSKIIESDKDEEVCQHNHCSSNRWIRSCCGRCGQHCSCPQSYIKKRKYNHISNDTTSPTKVKKLDAKIVNVNSPLSFGNNLTDNICQSKSFFESNNTYPFDISQNNFNHIPINRDKISDLFNNCSNDTKNPFDVSDNPFMTDNYKNPFFNPNTQVNQKNILMLKKSVDLSRQLIEKFFDGSLKIDDLFEIHDSLIVLNENI